MEKKRLPKKERIALREQKRLAKQEKMQSKKNDTFFWKVANITTGEEFSFDSFAKAVDFFESLENKNDYVLHEPTCSYDESTADVNKHAFVIIPQLMSTFNIERSLDISEKLYHWRLKNRDLESAIKIRTIDGFFVTEYKLGIRIEKIV